MTQEDAYGEWLVEDCMSRLTVKEHIRTLADMLSDYPMTGQGVRAQVDRIIQAAFEGGYEHGQKKID